MEDMDSLVGSKIAQEVNLLKQQSSQQMEVAMKREQSLQLGESIDRHMSCEDSLMTMERIESERKAQINAIPRSDPDYDNKVKTINKRAE